MSRSPIIVLTLSAALACGVACTPAPAPEVPVSPEVAPAPADKRAGDPMLDPTNYVGMDPPAMFVPRIGPTPLDATLPTVSPVPVPTSLPNVVLVLGCTVRKDQISSHGGHPLTTPFLTELAAQGASFDDAIAAAPWTRVASTAILTGHHASRIGMVQPDGQRNDKRLPDAITTLAERFQQAGYYTVGATANPNLNAEFGFAQGFDDYQLGLEDTWTAKLHGADLANAAVDAIRAHKAREDARPFFLRMMMLDPHAPREATSSAYEPFTQPGVPARVAQYRAQLHDLDAALRTLSDGLAAQGFDTSNTVFMFIADHGEGMNYPEHHGFGHGQYFGSSTVYVPWIVRGPGVAAGQRILGPASQVDVVPTLMGLIGKPIDEPELDGRDWSAWLRGERQVIHRRTVWSDTWFGSSSRAAVFTATTMCQQDFGSSAKQRKKGKFVPGCYNRIEDPLFTQPIDDPPLMAELIAWRTARAAEVRAHKADDVEVDAQVNEQLKMLGYTEDEEKP